MTVTVALKSIHPPVAESVVDTSVSEEYRRAINRFVPPKSYQTRDEINSADDALAEFKSHLSKEGAAKFLSELNEEKIETLVETLRQKLQDEKDANPRYSINIDKMVSDYRKLLIEEMIAAKKAAEDKEKEENKKDVSQAPVVATADILNSMQENEKSGSDKKAATLLEMMISAANTSPQIAAGSTQTSRTILAD